jgi:hypothetical protein
VTGGTYPPALQRVMLLKEAHRLLKLSRAEGFAKKEMICDVKVKGM